MMRKMILLVLTLAVLAFACRSASSSPTATQKTAVPQEAALKAVASSAVLPEPGSPMQVGLQIKDAPNDVHAFGLEVWFNPQALQFEKITREELLKKGFAIFKSNVTAPGKLRMGGIQSGATPLSGGATGKMLTLHFKIIGTGSPDLKLMNLKDHMENWPVRTGPCDARDGFSGLVLCPSAP